MTPGTFFLLQFAAVLQDEFAAPVQESVQVGGVYVNLSFGTTALSCLPTTTLTSIVPGGSEGDVALISFDDTKLTFVEAVEPNSTPALLAKFVPVILTDVDPVLGPEIGESFMIVGAFASIN
ncbi:MAG: hypothetical protein WAM97_21635 [Acidimicrobiales bacterium]